MAIGKELVEGLSLDKETVAWARYKYKETMSDYGKSTGNSTRASTRKLHFGRATS